MNRYAALLCGALSVSLLQGCLQPTVSKRIATVEKLGKDRGLTSAVIAADPFLLSSWHRMTAPGQMARVYIEGDGLAWLSRHTPSRDPTPVRAVAFTLMTQDQSPNVIYLARPCQFTGLANGEPCPQKYWTSARTAPEVIEAFGAALDHLKNTHNISGFELVGYSGGASVAALVAANRDDVTSLRTVAGNISYDAFIRAHNVSPLKLSLAPEQQAKSLSLLPQMHFIGKDDTVVPEAVFNDWHSRSQPSVCIQSETVAADHSAGWAESWAALLEKKPACLP
jgi:hypothetical protein